MYKRERINMDIAVCDDSMEALNDVRNVLIETNRVNLTNVLMILIGL